MAELELITGRTGEQHVLAIDDAEIYRTLLGNGDFILSTGHKFEARMNGANKVDIYDGTAIIQGRQMKIRSGYQELNTEGGVTGYRREDAIVLEYSKSGDIETAELKVIKGANNASAYKPPTLIQGNIDEGQTRQVRIWGVRYNGINFESLIDYRTILNTTPIQTALDTITAYQSQIEARIRAIREAVRVAPLNRIIIENASIQHSRRACTRWQKQEQGTFIAEPFTTIDNNSDIEVYIEITDGYAMLYNFPYGVPAETRRSGVSLSYDGDKTITYTATGSYMMCVVWYEPQSYTGPIYSYHLPEDKSDYILENSTSIFTLYLDDVRIFPTKYYVSLDPVLRRNVIFLRDEQLLKLSANIEADIWGTTE